MGCQPHWMVLLSPVPCPPSVVLSPVPCPPPWSSRPSRVLSPRSSRPSRVLSQRRGRLSRSWCRIFSLQSPATRLFTLWPAASLMLIHGTADGRPAELPINTRGETPTRREAPAAPLPSVGRPGSSTCCGRRGGRCRHCAGSPAEPGLMAARLPPGVKALN